MNLKTIVIILLTYLMFYSCKDDSNNFNITIQLEHPGQLQFKLYRLTTEELIPVDSTQIPEKSTYQLKGFTEYPQFFMIQYLNNEKIYLVLQPDDKIDIKIDNTQPRPAYHVKGSSESMLIRDLTFRQERVLREITRLSEEYEKAKSIPDRYYEEKQRVDSLYYDLLEQHKQFTTDFIRENPQSLACVLALYQNFGRNNIPLFDKYKDLEIFDFVDSNLTVLYPYTEAVVALNRDVTDVKEQILYNKVASRQLEVGKPIKGIRDVTIEGDSVTTFNDRYNYYIICFWAVWNNESVEVINNLNDLQRKYTWQKFRFITISLDKSDTYLKDFLSENNIELPVICDYRYWDSDYVKFYGLHHIPYIFIINNNNFVVQKDITISELENTIKGLLNN